MTSDLLEEALLALDAPQRRYAELERYARGEQQLAWISPESRKALGNRMSRLASNIPALQINSLVERLRPVAFSDPRAWDLFIRTDMDTLAARAMTAALLYGTGYVLTWSKDGRPVASVESPRQCRVLRAAEDRSVTAGVKRFSTKDQTIAYLYLPDRIEKWTAPGAGAAIGGFTLAETVDNPLGQVILTPIDNGHSEIRDLLPLCDALNKLLSDMMVASEAAGRPRRWIAGLELTERPRLDDAGNQVLGDDGQPIIDVVSPIDEVDTVKVAISENPETKFGTWPASDLTGFREGVQVIVSQLSAVSSLPAHYLSPLTAAQVPSADGLRAAEASLTARAESKQQRFSSAFEQVGRLLIAIDNPGTDPASLPLRVQWASAATRSEAQEADAAVKLYQSGLLSRPATLARLGFTEDEITAEMANIKADANDARAINLDRIISGSGTA